MIAITFALPVESAAFIKTLSDKRRERSGDLEIVRGKIDNREIEIFHTGVGEKICRHRIATFLHGRDFELLISAGFAGGLTDKLKPGDIFVAENFSSAEVRLANVPVQFGELVTVGQVIDSPDERAKIARATGAAAIDMETEFIARACAEHALPMISLRAISDTPARPLPLPPHVLFDIEQQKTRATKLSIYLLTHPARIARMISFIRQVQTARRSLSRALDAILRGTEL